MKLIILIFSVLICLTLNAEKGPVTGLELPRFVSLKSNDVNLRVGPSINYPIKIKYIEKNLPVEVIDEFDTWRKIKDYDDNIGWLHKSLIKGDRFILTVTKKENNKNIYNRPNGTIIGIINNNNILSLENCLINWCFISHDNLKGWLSKESIWGVYKEEIFNKSFYQPLINQYWKILNNKYLNIKLNK